MPVRICDQRAITKWISEIQFSVGLLTQSPSNFHSIAVWLYEWKVDVFIGEKRGRWRNMIGSAERVGLGLRGER